MRLEVATDKGLTVAQAKRLVGATREDLEADAEELLSSFQPATNNADGVRVRPVEALKGGGQPDTAPEETDPAKLAELVPRGGF